jgi:hypothetical protein
MKLRLPFVAPGRREGCCTEASVLNEPILVVMVELSPLFYQDGQIF